MSLAPEEPNVYSHGRQSDDPAPEERNVPAMSKSSNDISLLTELAEILRLHCSINIQSLTGLLRGGDGINR